ncbi:hypothetical protein C9E85_09635 [Plesiomonas shigelloides]|nr:hypothetical protein C9E85_09635 [Plesiomonas shigelloides]
MADVKIGAKAKKTTGSCGSLLCVMGQFVLCVARYVVAVTLKVARRGRVTGKKKPLKPSGVVQHTK